MKKLLLLKICFAFLICGCNHASVDTVSSNNVESSQVYQIYEIEAEKMQTRITATFRVGGGTGTTLELTEPGKISYNDAPVPISAPGNLIGTNYRMKGTDYRAFLKNYRPAHEFSFTDNDGKIYKNSVNLLPLEVSGKSVFALQSSQPTTLRLSRAVAEDENLTIALDSIIDDQIPTSDNSVYLSENRSAVVITPKYWLAKSLKGKAELKIKVKKNAAVSEGTQLGGSISAVYSAASVFLSGGGAKTAAADANVKPADNNSKKKRANIDQKTNAVRLRRTPESGTPRTEKK